MQDNNQMHPQDMRNLILFAVLSISMWLAYDHFIARPHADAIRQANEAAQVKALASAPADVLATAEERPRAEIISSTERLAISTPTVDGSINLTGARLDDLRLKNYFKTVDRQEEVAVLSPARSEFPRYTENGWVPQDADVRVPDGDTVWRVKQGSAATLTPETPVTITTTVDGNIFEKTYSIDSDYGFRVESRFVNNTGYDLTLYPYALVTEHGTPEDYLNQGSIHEGPIGYFGEELYERDYKDFEDKRQESFDAGAGWIGLTGKYWLTAVVPVDAEGNKYRFVSTPAVGQNTKERFQADIMGPAVTAAPGETGSETVHVFSGPKQVELLDRYEKEWNAPHFDLAVDFGLFYFLTKPFFWCLNQLYNLTGNFGIAIIIFTCFLRILVFPLANTSYRSFAKLRQISPEMYDLRHQYKDNKQKLQEELVKLYQRNNVNPAAGCLPILVQIPIFFALYKVLSNTIEMRHAPFFGWIHDLSAMDPTTIFNGFGLLPYDVPHILMIGAWPCLMLLGMIMQRNISPPPEDPIQARLIQIMPWVTTFIMAKFASGLVIYWTFNNLLAILQQIIIMKSMNVPIHLFSEDKWKKKLKKEIEEGPSVHPSIEMVEQEVEKDLFGDEDGKTASAPVSKPKPKKKKKK